MNQATGPTEGELRQRVRDGLGSGKLFRVDGQRTSREGNPTALYRL